MENRKLWYYSASLKPFVSKKLNFFLLWYKNEKPSSFPKAVGWKPSFKVLFSPDDKEVVVFAANICPNLQTWRMMCQDFWRPSGWQNQSLDSRCVQSMMDYMDTACTSMNISQTFDEQFILIAYSAEYWRSLRKLVRFPYNRLIHPLWELIDGFDIVDWFSILQGIT